MKLLCIVLVVILYENDFCDIVKVMELYYCEYFGGYEKVEMEDIVSIIQGIIGYKGCVIVNFLVLISDVLDIFVVLVECIDQYIYIYYQLYLINYLVVECSDKKIFEQCK